MELHTLGHDHKNGWSVKSRPRIDSRQTLVVVFGSTSLLDAPGPMNELLEEYGESVVVGCSTAGEILGTQIFDESLSAAIARFDHTDLRMAGAPVQSVEGSLKAGQEIAQQLNDSRLRGILVLSRMASM